jgi:ADP-dependent NAD(P)H-hydrate dehydratase / NAD(P)H-hydrate epimerase
MPSLLLPISSALPLLNSAALRALERSAQAHLPPGTLMERAGLAVARLVRARWPAAQRIEFLCGPGNNGGDGLVAARHLHQLGLAVQVRQVKGSAQPPDRRRAEDQAIEAGVPVADSTLLGDADLVVDALLGIGLREAPRGALAERLRQLAGHAAPRLAVDLPSGLDADQGRDWGAVPATTTLSLLGVKPGLLTGAGRSLCGELWHDDLSVSTESPASAWATGHGTAWRRWAPRALDRAGAHKGDAGVVWVMATAPSMVGAGRLAARSALAAGAGRVYLAGASGPDPQQPELMTPDPAAAEAALPSVCAVAGCGGGPVAQTCLPPWLRHAGQLVLDADGLNAIARDPALARALRARADRGQRTVITPHPLEAARLLGLASAADVQQARLEQAEALVQRFACTVVLKGSGSIVAAAGAAPSLNTTGSAALGSAGTGDVLAGWLGGLMAQAPQAPLPELARIACAWHGAGADQAASGCGPVRATDLIAAMRAATP